MEKWNKKSIMESVEKLELLGQTCSSVRSLPKNASIKELNEAWNQDRCILKGIANDIMIWV